MSTHTRRREPAGAGATRNLHRYKIQQTYQDSLRLSYATRLMRNSKFNITASLL